MTVDVAIELVDPESDEALAAVAAFSREVGRRFGVRLHPVPDTADLRPPTGCFLLARRGDEVVGCGGLRLLDETTGEVKRMWLDPVVRGAGLAGRLLARLENEAAVRGCARVVLDTSDRLEAAVGLYRASGNREIAAYNDNPEARLWFEKPVAL